jgi:hypothetical protein
MPINPDYKHQSRSILLINQALSWFISYSNEHGFLINEASSILQPSKIIVGFYYIAVST